MHRIALAALGLIFAAGAALAQPMTSGSSMGSGATMDHSASGQHSGRSAPRRAMRSERGGSRSAATGSDAAYNGGGVILEGPPGAPAPMPQALTMAPGGGTVVQVPATGVSQQRPMSGAPMR